MQYFFYYKKGSFYELTDGAARSPGYLPRDQAGSARARPTFTSHLCVEILRQAAT